MFIDKLTKAERRLSKEEICNLINTEKLQPWRYTKSVLLDILNYQRLTREDFVLLGQKQESENCKTCRELWGHPDNCLGCEEVKP